MHPSVVGVDVGGTKVAAAVVDPEGRMAGHVQQRTELATPDLTLCSIADAVDKAVAASGVSRGDLAGVGLGIPGKVDPERGIGILSVNLGWRDVPVKERLEAMLNFPCTIENDVKAAALGEYRYGAGQGVGNMIYLSIGTGISAGIVLNGRLYRGATGMAGEIGHAIVDPVGAMCKCGVRGCLEAVAAGPAIAALAQAGVRAGRKTAMKAGNEGGNGLTAEAVFDAAARGDELANEILDGVGAQLALAIQFLIMSFDPQRVVLGGGVALAGELLLQPVERALKRQAEESFVFREMWKPGAVRLSALGKDAGILGAAALVAPAWKGGASAAT